jgi:hypothetical protein
LAYVICKDKVVPTNNPDGGYATIQDEMKAHAPHFTMAGAVRTPDPTCMVVNGKKVWEIIAKITRKHAC